MKILLTNNHLVNVGGTEMWTYAVVKELVRLGHDVHVYAHVRTQSKETTQADRIAEFCKVIDIPDSEYDLILINHNTCLKDVERVRGYKVFTSHGRYVGLEQPVKGADKYVAISEEVQDHMRGRGFESVVIRNGIDLEYFKPVKPVNEKLRNVLCLCHGESAQQKVKEACEQMGLNVLFHDKKNNKTWDMREAIEWADLVVSLGRGAYEAMAMGREVLVYDERAYAPVQGTDGLVRESNFRELVQCNMSGRARALISTIETIKNQLSRYDAVCAQKNRKIAKKHLNIRKQVQKYLDLYEQEKDTICRKKNRTLSIVLPSYQCLPYLKITLDSLLDNTYYDFELIIIDDCSDNDVIEFLQEIQDNCKVTYNTKKRWVTGAWNDGIQQATGEYVAVINNDITFSKNWDLHLMDALNDDVWIASPYMTDPNKGTPFVNTERAPHIALCGPCFMLKKETFEKIGPIPESMKIWGNDSWLSWTVKTLHKKETVFVLEACIHHFKSKASQSLSDQNRQLWLNIIDSDMKEFRRIKGEWEAKNDIIGSI